MEALRSSRTSLYCGLLLNQTIIGRGFFDATIDAKACFDTEAELAVNTARNQELILQFATSEISQVDVNLFNPFTKVMLQACAGQNRGTGFDNPFYSGAYADVCNSNPQTNINTNGNIRSIWLEGGSCAAITITSNEYPWPRVTFVDWSTALDSYLYVYNYRWTPKC
ncbi:MAG: hypothetical protein HC828_10525 [Blastochloris sp.]|nr:hypothetical protein [Blastochloris sp.]